MTYRIMTAADLPAAAELYVKYYNTHEDGEWTHSTASKRIDQVLTRKDSYCLVLEDCEALIGFAMGYFEQYDDCFAYDLVEIIVAKEHQGSGVGTAFMHHLEKSVKAEGAMLIQLQAVNDGMHEHFYTKLGYKTAKNFVLKTKML